MMRITHFLGGLGTGGAEMFTVNLAYEHIRMGLDVQIIAIGKQRGLPWKKASARNIPMVELHRRRWDVRTIADLRAAAGESDILHVHLFPALYWAALGYPRDAPWVYTEHSTSNRRRDIAMLRPFERFAYMRPSRIVAISRGVAEQLESHMTDLSLSREIALIENGIGNEFFDRSRRQRGVGEGTRIVCVGALDRRKNFTLALEVLRLLPNAKMSIVGDGPERGRLKSHAHSIGVADRVAFLGHAEDLVDILDDHRVLLSTSVVEGFGLVVAEAMARGIPVVAPNIPGVRGLIEVGMNGLLYDHGPEAAMEAAGAISRLVASEPAYSEYSANSIRSAERYSMPRVAMEYLTLYRRAAQ